MMFAKNVLLGSLSFATVLMVGNWSGLIANAAPDPVFKPILQDIRNQLPRGMMMRLPSVLKLYGYQNREFDVYPEINSRNNNTNRFSINLNTQPNCLARACFYGYLRVYKFLEEFESSLISSPISTKRNQRNKICGILTRKNIALSSSVQAVSVDYDFCGADSGRRNHIIWKQDGYFFVVAVGTSNIDIATSMANEPPIYDSSTARQTSTYSQNSTQGLQNLPDGDYAYRQTVNSSSRLDISRYFIFKKAGVSAVGYHFQPNTDYVYCWQGDLQGNSLVNIVNAEPRFGRGVSGYDFVNAKSEDLLSYQRVDANSLFVQSSKLRQSFQECISLFRNKTSNAIPSVSPSSSTPVRPTDTIAKYPSNNEFNAFDNKLRSKPESLVKLRGNQAEQRRKFQNEWKTRNPNAAKFLGAWYTGDRYFYVFPSTVKGGTCVVTQDANGKLEMQVGTVLNRELRYSGGKGFFWRDRPNIIASRDSGSGSLYPIYATSGMPELPESMIGDMERQKCITTLPN